MKLKNRIKRKKNSRKKAFINGHLRLDKMYLIIIVAIFIFLAMGVGYALLNDKISNMFKGKIEIMDISIYSKTIGSTNLYDPTYDDMTLLFNLCLSDKTDSIIYLVTIKNNSNLSKKLNNVFIKSSNNNDITYSLEGININDIIPPQTATTFKIKINYRNDLKMITNKCVGMNINLDYIDYIDYN